MLFQLYFKLVARVLRTLKRAVWIRDLLWQIRSHVNENEFDILEEKLTFVTGHFFCVSLPKWIFRVLFPQRSDYSPSPSSHFNCQCRESCRKTGWWRHQKPYSVRQKHMTPNIFYTIGATNEQFKIFCLSRLLHGLSTS